MANVLPQGPLSAYLGVRNQNMEADREGIGLLAKLQAVQQENKRRADELQFRKEDRADARVLARETRDLQLGQAKELREKELAFRADQAEKHFQVRMGQLGLEKQFKEAQLANIADSAAQKKARDAFEMDFKDRELQLRREIQDFKTSQAQQGAGLSGEAAGKIAMADRAVLDIQEARTKLFKDGKMDRGLIAAMNIPFTAGMPLNEDARGAYSRLHNAVAAKLRIETGAAATESEVRGILDRFLPKISDTDQVVRDRLDSLEQFMNTTIDQTKGVRLDALESRKGKKPATPAVPTSGWSIRPAP